MLYDTSIQTWESSDQAGEAFNRFLTVELAAAAPLFADGEDAIYLYCQLAPRSEPSRRLLVVSDHYSQVVRVCIEAAYELFKGDIHHHVLRIGTVNREDVAAGLEPLLREAFNRLMAWRPTHENIWDNVY